MKLAFAFITILSCSIPAWPASPAESVDDPLARSLREAQATQFIFENRACALKHPELDQTMQALMLPAMDIVFGKGQPAAKGHDAAQARFKKDLQKVIDQWRANSTTVDPSLTVERCKMLPVALDLKPDMLARQRSFFESEIGLLSGYEAVCAEAFASQVLQMTPLLQGFIKTVLGETPETAQKLKVLLARPDIKALMQGAAARALSDKSKDAGRFSSECLQR